MKKSIVILAAALLVAGVNKGFAHTETETNPADSVSNKISYSFAIGSKIGGASPLGFPAEIRKINSFSPAVPFFVQAKAEYTFSQKWGMSVGVTFEGKGMNTKANVKGYQTTFNDNSDESNNISGYYYGDISTNVQNLYVTVPILANYKLSPKWDFQAGPYIAFAVQKRFFGEAQKGYLRNITPTGEKVIIEDAAYRFDNSIRNVDYGATVGARYAISSRYYALGQFDYGFSNIMKNGFETISFGLHNIFLNLGVGIKLP
ncbi:porin family protein [Sphingobacterium sp. MYb382]|uniref:porin family protein n=1 Tax=Sphingobacterium sp. MYb382 TaxID=2745278 RepID=UPI00309C3237